MLFNSLQFHKTTSSRALQIPYKRPSSVFLESLETRLFMDAGVNVVEIKLGPTLAAKFGNSVELRYNPAHANWLTSGWGGTVVDNENGNAYDVGVGKSPNGSWDFMITLADDQFTNDDSTAPTPPTFQTYSAIWTGIYWSTLDWEGVETTTAKNHVVSLDSITATSSGTSGTSVTDTDPNSVPTITAYSDKVVSLTSSTTQSDTNYQTMYTISGGSTGTATISGSSITFSPGATGNFIVTGTLNETPQTRKIIISLAGQTVLHATTPNPVSKSVANPSTTFVVTPTDSTGTVAGQNLSVKGSLPAGVTISSEYNNISKTTTFTVTVSTSTPTVPFTIQIHDDSDETVVDVSVTVVVTP